MDELATLERLVRRYSPSGREGSAVREFVRLAQELGYSAHADAAGNGIASRGRGRPIVLFLGHIDTVEGRLPVRRARGRLYGRGTVDAKGPLAAALWAGRFLTGPGEFRVVAAVGEETDSRGARALLRRTRPDAVIAGEPSGGDGITVGYKGELQLIASFRGRRTHLSSPTPTATDVALEWIGAVQGHDHSHAGESPFRSLTMMVVGVESVRDADAETARVTLDFRLPPGYRTGALLRELPREPHRPSIAVRIRVDPVEVDRSNPVVRSLVEGIRVAGGRPTLWRKGGTSDLNLSVRAWGVPGAAYGPGDPHLDHTARESVPAAELARSVRVLRTALERLRSELSIPRRSGVGA